MKEEEVQRERECHHRHYRGRDERVSPARKSRERERERLVLSRHSPSAAPPPPPYAKAAFAGTVGIAGRRRAAFPPPFIAAFVGPPSLPPFHQSRNQLHSQPAAGEKKVFPAPPPLSPSFVFKDRKGEEGLSL